MIFSRTNSSSGIPLYCEYINEGNFSTMADVKETLVKEAIRKAEEEAAKKAEAEAAEEQVAAADETGPGVSEDTGNETNTDREAASGADDGSEAAGNGENAGEEENGFTAWLPGSASELTVIYLANGTLTGAPSSQSGN